MMADVRTLSPMLNRAYQSQGYTWPHDANMEGFQAWLEGQGLRADLMADLDDMGRFSHKIVSVEILDQQRYQWFVLTWG